MRAADIPNDLAGPFDPDTPSDRADEEIPLEDREHPDFENCFDQAEAESGDEAPDEDKGKDDCATNLFAYAAPLAVHRKVLSLICAIHTRTHLIVLTRTGHPGLLVAGRGFGLKVIAFVDGVSKHSLGHGSLLLKKLLMSSKMAAARAARHQTRHQAHPCWRFPVPSGPGAPGSTGAPPRHHADGEQLADWIEQ